MADLAARAEAVKLARDLGIEESALAFLHDKDSEAVAALRRDVGRARFAHIEPRLARLAASSNLLPIAASAKIAKTMLGARMCGRMAGVLDVPAAIRFAGQYDAVFLAELSLFLDPERSKAVIAAIEPGLSIDVGVHLLELGEYLALGRLVSAAPDEVVERVIDRASADQLLQIAYYTDDHERLDAVLARRADADLEELVVAAVPDNAEHALTVYSFLGRLQRSRLVEAARRTARFDVLSALAPQHGLSFGE